jgi:hypothetical protein
MAAVGIDISREVPKVLTTEACAAWAGDRQLLAPAGSDHTVRLWHPEEGTFTGTGGRGSESRGGTINNSPGKSHTIVLRDALVRSDRLVCSVSRRGQLAQPGYGSRRPLVDSQ